MKSSAGRTRSPPREVKCDDCQCRNQNRHGPRGPGHRISTSQSVVWPRAYPGPISFQIHRIYEGPGPSGYRVLVDRLWPRGVKKSAAELDEWLKDAAPSTELRRWYGHDVERFGEFARRYRGELRRPPASDAVNRLLELLRTGRLTLVTATRDLEHSGAWVLQQVVADRASPTHRPARRSGPGGVSHGNRSSAAAPT